jgi:RHS repeat-associated protein
MSLLVACGAHKSLGSMWRAYCASNFVAQNRPEFRGSVVQALLNARYYDSARGQFLSEDPVFWGEPKGEVLTDPQSLNTYSYSVNNPIIKKDPSGKAFGVDDAAGFFGGGLVGAGAAAIADFSVGRRPTMSELTGAFVTGGIIGWGAVNTPETLGASNAISASIVTGLIGGGYGDLAKQEIDLATGKQRGGLNANELESSALVTSFTNGALEGIVPNARIAGYSAGPGNMYATGRSMLTKASNGTISNVSFSTGVKSAVGSQVAGLYRTAIDLLR